ADPSAEILKKIPIHNNTFLRPYFWVGSPPKMAPTTVPHKAIDIIKKPWNQGEVCHNSFIGRLAPEMTTVSKPKIKPARAAISEIPNRLAVDDPAPFWAVAPVLNETCMLLALIIS